MKRVCLAACVLAIVLALAVPAAATHTNLSDDSDTRGMLDLSGVVFRHDSGPYQWVFRTFRSWTVKKIWDRGFFVVEVETLGNRRIDYLVVMRSNGRSMVGDLLRKRANGNEVHLRRLRSARAGSRGASVEVPRRALTYGPSRTSFFWTTLSMFTGPRCRAACIDLAPDDGSLIEQALPTPSPSPSP